MAVPVSVEPFTEPESTRGFSPAWVDRLLAAPFTRALIGAVLVLVLWADAAREGFWGLPSPFEASEGLGGYALALAAGGAVGGLWRRRHRPAPSDTSPRLPVFLRFDHRRVIVVGGGEVAASKLPALAGLLREAFDELVPADIGTWVERARELRRRQHAEGVPMANRRPQLLEVLNRLYDGRDRPAAGR